MKQCREHNCPLQDICRGAVDNETWWNISDKCEIFAFVSAQADKIFELENRLKECENGYEGTLHLESCKLHDAEEKFKELTQAHDMLSESYDHLEKIKDNLLAERARLTEENERLRGENEKIGIENFDLICELSRIKEEAVRKMQERLKKAFNFGFTILEKSICDIIDQIAKEMLDGDNENQ